MNASAPKDIAALLKEDRTYDVVPTHVLASMNGLEFMQSMIDGKIPAPPITGTMGFLITRVEKGYALAEAIPSFDYYNPRCTAATPRRCSTRCSACRCTR